MPTIAVFQSWADADDWRRYHGGHIFLSDSGAIVWFDLSHTIGDVMRSAYLHGMSGTVNPRIAA